MLRFTRRFAKFFKGGEEGASFVEYGLLLIVVVLAIGAAATTLGADITTFLNNLGDKIITWVGPAQP